MNASVKMVGSALKARGEHLKKVEDTRQNHEVFDDGIGEKGTLVHRVSANEGMV